MTPLVLSLALTLPAAPPGSTPVEIVAHRGASWDAPENTLVSINLGWKQNTDTVEIDIYLSKDGRIVLSHDKSLKRTTGVNKLVTELTAEEISRLDAGAWKGKQFTGERVPTLEQVLATVPKGKRLFIEVKCGPEIVPELNRVLKAAKLDAAQTAVICFSAPVIAEIKKVRPDLTAYYLASLRPSKGKPAPTVKELIAQAKAIHADGLDLSAEVGVLTAAFAAEVKAAGLELHVWTVDDVDTARKMIEVGVQSITTNRPEWLRARLAEDPAQVRVMSFNVRYGTAKDGENNWDRRKDLLVHTIQTFSPDLLGTQETLGFQRDFIAKALKATHATFGVGRDDGKEQGEMMAIFYRTSRFEKIAGGHFWLSETPDKPGSKSWDSSLPRMASWLKLRDRTNAKALPILFVNTHFDHRGPVSRVEAAKLIRKKLQTLGAGCRLVVTGDFNSAEGSEPYTALFGEVGGQASPVRDSFRIAHPKKEKGQGTISGFHATPSNALRIDWIGCSPDWSIDSAGIDHTSRDGRAPSDHFPITAVLLPSREKSELPSLSDSFAVTAILPHANENEPKARPTLRILTYNIHHAEGNDRKLDLKRIANIISDTKPDFVAVQEVDHTTTRTERVDQTAELMKLTGLNGVFGKAIDFGGGGYGQAVLSRHPLGKSTVHQLPGDPKQEQRIAIEVPFRIHDRELLFVSTHLDHQNDTIRDQQAVKLNELFGKRSQPVILAGDLNATPTSKPIQTLAKMWTITPSGIDAPTVPATNPRRQIDYVIFRATGAFRVVSQEVLDEPIASDHRPVLVVLEWLEPKSK